MNKLSLLFSFLTLSYFVSAQITLSANVTSGCAPLTVDFSLSGLPTDYSHSIWDFDMSEYAWAEPNLINGNSHQKTFTVSGKVYHVSVDIYNMSQSLIATKTIDVQLLGSTYSISSNNLDSGEVFTYQTTGNNPVWNFGDGNTSSTSSGTHSYVDNGIYTISCQSSSSECGTVSDTILVLSGPFEVLGSDTICSGFPAVYQIETDNSDFEFHIQNYGIVSKENYVVYNLNLDPWELLFGIWDPYQQTYFGSNWDYSPTYYFQGGTSNVSPSSANVGDAINFNSAGSIDTTIWNFGDGVIDTIAGAGTLIHSYSMPNLYTVSSMLSNQNCGPNTKEFLVAVGNPSFNMQEDTVCVGEDAVYAFNYSSPAIHKTRWDFGDGTVMENLNFQQNHQYLNPGTYQVNLKLFDSLNNLLYTTQQTITVVGLQITSLNPTVFLGESLVYQINGIFNSVSWDFGDGSTSNLSSGAHLYPQEGAYSIILNADVTNCPFSDTFELVVLPSQFEFSQLEFCDTLATRLFFNSQNMPIDCRWDFGDGSYFETNTLLPTFHAYADSGEYLVRLILLNNTQAYDTLTQIVEVSKNFAVNHFLNKPRVFVNEPFYVKVDGFGFSSFTWDFGDGTSSNLDSVSHRYPNFISDRIITLSVNTDDCGVMGYEIPIKSFSEITFPEAFCADSGFIVDILEFVYVYAGSYVDLALNFGNGETIDAHVEGVPGGEEPYLFQDTVFYTPGTYTISYTRVNHFDDGAIVDHDVTSFSTTITIEDCSAANLDNKKLSEIKIFPNPSEGYVYFANLQGNLVEHIKIFNSNGQLICERKELVENQLDASFLTEGVYFLEFDVDGNTQRSKMILVK